MVKLLYAVFFILSVASGVVHAQKSNDPWLRVTTGEEYYIEIDKNSLTLKDGDVYGASFRTSYAKESTSGSKCLVRLDSIDFQVSSHSYRVISSTCFTSGGAVPHTTNFDVQWKRLRSGTSQRFYSAAAKLAPFGSWKVVSYRYASGEGPSNGDPMEIRSMVGSTVSLRLDNLFIGRSNCSDATFDFRSLSDQAFERYGLMLKNLGIVATSEKAIIAVCRSNKDYPPQTLILLSSPTKATMLWDGILFEIERLPNLFS